jgi:hypothetical protein
MCNGALIGFNFNRPDVVLSIAETVRRAAILFPSR